MPLRHLRRHASVTAVALLLGACSQRPDITAPDAPDAAEPTIAASRFETNLLVGHVTDASVFVVHGINGRDLGLPEALPVDVEVNGGCAVPGLTFRAIKGPLRLPGGSYDIKVRLAASTPCSGTAVIEVAGAEISAGQNLSIVAHLDASGKPIASIFANSLTGSSRTTLVAARHTAAFDAVDIAVNGARVFTGVENGQDGTIKALPGIPRISVFPAGAASAALRIRAVVLPGFLNVFYAVGTPAKGTLELLQQQILLVGEGSAYVSLLHGINGRDLGLDEALPVDVEVNGLCALAGVTFRTIARTRPIASGSYDIVVHLAARNRCTGPAAITAPGVRFEPRRFYSVVAHLSAEGAPTASVFENTLTGNAGEATVAARHAAAFGPVDVLVNGGVAFAGVTNGQGGTAALRPGAFRLGIAPAGSPTAALTARPFALGSPFVNAFYAVGTPSKGTFEVITERVLILPFLFQ